MFHSFSRILEIPLLRLCRFPPLSDLESFFISVPILSLFLSLIMSSLKTALGPKAIKRRFIISSLLGFIGHRWTGGDSCIGGQVSNSQPMQRACFFFIIFNFYDGKLFIFCLSALPQNSENACFFYWIVKKDWLRIYRCVGIEFIRRRSHIVSRKA